MSNTTPETGVERLAAVRVGTLGDGNETCNRCGGENVIWAAQSPLWNKVMRGNDINGEPRYRDLVCLRCFVVLAREAGIDGTWRLDVTPEPDGLIYETPSGRIWDADSWLWRDPDPVVVPAGETGALTEDEQRAAAERVGAWLDANWKYVSDDLGRDLRILAARTPARDDLAAKVRAKVSDYDEEPHSDECGFGACARCVVDEFAALLDDAEGAR